MPWNLKDPASLFPENVNFSGQAPVNALLVAFHGSKPGVIGHFL
jgi:hypothetical protein